LHEFGGLADVLNASKGELMKSGEMRQSRIDGFVAAVEGPF
jgi:hypothetical protein